MQKQAMASSKFLLLSLALLLIALSFIPTLLLCFFGGAMSSSKWKASLKIPNNSQIVSSWTPLPMNTSAPALCPSWFGIACNADDNSMVQFLLVEEHETFRFCFLGRKVVGQLPDDLAKGGKLQIFYLKRLKGGFIHWTAVVWHYGILASRAAYTWWDREMCVSSFGWKLLHLEVIMGKIPGEIISSLPTLLYC
ncbi:hypothetical protein Tco_1037114 [Tanacetum coccineum]